MTGSLLGFLFDVVSGTGVIAEVDHASKPVETVTNRNIQSLSKDSVALLRVCDDLGVSARDVQHDWILRTRDLSSHLDVCGRRVSRKVWTDDIDARPTQ